MIRLFDGRDGESLFWNFDKFFDRIYYIYKFFYNIDMLILMVKDGFL